MRLIVLQICIFLLLSGCKKDPETTPESPQKTPAASPEAEKPPPPKAAPIEIPGAKGDSPLPRDNRSTAAICMRACNKAQQCGTSSGSVSACVETCQKMLDGKSADNQRTAQGFRAQYRCASEPCPTFDQCVGKALAGEKELAQNPAISPNKAESMCRELCAQEQRCHPELAKRRGDIKNCLVACKSVLINPAPELARNRSLMTLTHSCLNSDCKVVEQCVLKAITQK